MLRSVVLLALPLALFSVACGGDDKPPPRTPAPKPAPEPDEPPEMTVRKTEGLVPGGDAPTPRPKPKKEMAVDYDMTNSDCETLGRVYGTVWLNDKLEPMKKRKMTDKQRKLETKNYEKASQEAAENWKKACYSIVGTPFPLDRLKCAGKQKTEKDFNACWDGVKKLE